MNSVKKFTTWAMVILILILGIVFTLLNFETVNVSLGFKVFSVPLILLMVLMFAAGLLLGLLAGFSRAFYLYRKKEKEEVALKLNM